MFSSRSLQFSKAILAILVGLSLGCQKSKFSSKNYLQDHLGVSDGKTNPHRPIPPFTDFPDNQNPIYGDKEEEAPATEEGPRPQQPEQKPGENTSEETNPENPSENTPEAKWVPEGMEAEDFSNAAKMNPTIYYHPVIKNTEDRCKEEDRTDMLTIDDQVLVRLCKVDLAKCSLQGTCTVVEGENRRSFNHHSLKGGVDRYFEMKQSACVYGYGVTNICLDPFYSVAADLTIYKPGTVIFVPSVRGTTMPNGKPHTGFFVVRDRGGGVKGAGRFDFFTGSYSWNSDNNPFKSLDLGDPRKPQKFFVVKSEEVSEATLDARNFPSLPQAK